MNGLPKVFQQSSYPSVGIENIIKKTLKQAWRFFLFKIVIRDLDWIQTSNLLSRNQVRYSVAPRGLLIGMQI